MSNKYIYALTILSLFLLLPAVSNAQVEHEACEVLQITDAPEDSRNPYVCANGTGILLISRADLANNGHADQEDLFFADITDPFNPVFYQLTNTDRSERGNSISEDCTEIAFNSRSDLTGDNPSNFDQLFYGDISDPNNPSFTQLTNVNANNQSVSPNIADDGSKIAFSTNNDVTGMNPDNSQEYFIFDDNNGVVPIEQLTNDPANVGSISTAPRATRDASRVTFATTQNFMPPGQNGDGGGEVYLSEITYNPPNLPAHTLYQITQLTPGFRANSPDISRGGEKVSFSTTADITGMNPSETRQLFIADVNNPAVPQIIQITKSDDFTSSRGILSETGREMAFITENPDFNPTGDGNTENIVLADILDNSNPGFTSITNFFPGTDIDDLSASRDFRIIAFESDDFIISGGSNDGNEEVYIVFPRNCNVIAIPTLSEWGLIAMAGVLGIVGFMVMRRRKVVV